MACASGAEATITTYWSAGTDCSGASTVGYTPGGATVKASLCANTDFESICGSTLQLQAASGAESGKFRIDLRELGPIYPDPNAVTIPYPEPITNPAQTTDYGGTVNSPTPPSPGANQLLATFTLEPLSTATNASYDIGLTGASNVAIDSNNCFGSTPNTPTNIPIAATLVMSRSDLVPDPPRLANISTRGQVQTGFNVMIGGFVIGGSANKTVVVRAIGPSLANFGVSGALADPQLQLVRSADQVTIATNDNWGTASNAAQLQASGFAPSNALESAIYTALPPGAYTAIVSGVNNTSGVGLVEVYEVDQPATPLINISTRGQVQTGFNVMIGGFVIQGNGPQTVVVRAIGPSLANFGVSGALANPQIQLVRQSDQTIIASNDDWGSDPNASQVQSNGFAPSNPLESAIYITLQPGAYTAIVSGVGGGTGVGLVEVYKVGP